MTDRTQELLDRTFNFGISVLRILKKMPDSYIDRITKGQLARAATAIGANYEEAQGAVSKRDFANKVGICFKESRECAYWIRVILELTSESSHEQELQKLLGESIELKKIFSAIKKTAMASILK